MPYIKQEDRSQYDEFLDPLIVTLVNNTLNGKKNNGHVVYAIYKLLKFIYGDNRFEQMSNALKVGDDALREYFERIMKPYEDRKRVENGPVTMGRPKVE